MIVWPILWILAMVAMVLATIVVAMGEAKARRKAAEVVRQQQAALQQSAAEGSPEMGQQDEMGVGASSDFGGFDDFK